MILLNKIKKQLDHLDKQNLEKNTNNPISYNESNTQILEEQYNILHKKDIDSKKNIYNNKNKITMLEVRNFVKQQHENRKKVIMTYVFWLRLYNAECNYYQLFNQYNISINEYTTFEKDRFDQIQKQVNHYISNRKMKDGLLSSNIFDKLNNKKDFKEFVSKNENELKSFVENISQYSIPNDRVKHYVKSMNDILNTKYDLMKIFEKL
jgi:hypothetical protein